MNGAINNFNLEKETTLNGFENESYPKNRVPTILNR